VNEETVSLSDPAVLPQRRKRWWLIPLLFFTLPSHPRRAWAPASYERSWKPHQTGKTKRDPWAFSGVKRHWSRASHKRPIDSISMDEARCGAICPGKLVPVLKTLGKCSCLRAKPAHIPGHLPFGHRTHWK